MNNPILMVDPTGMAADTIHLRPVDVFKDAPKREPVQGLWQHTVHTFMAVIMMPISMIGRVNQ